MKMKEYVSKQSRNTITLVTELVDEAFHFSELDTAFSVLEGVPPQVDLVRRAEPWPLFFSLGGIFNKFFIVSYAVKPIATDGTTCRTTDVKHYAHNMTTTTRSDNTGSTTN
jgi:hypothetical protein